MGGVMTPFVETHGLYFSDEMEPQDRAFEAIKDVERYGNDKFDVNINMGETYEEYIERLEFIDKTVTKTHDNLFDYIDISD
jgi:hypothetical protein